MVLMLTSSTRLSSAARAKSARISTSGVAALPCTNTRCPLFTKDTACSADMYLPMFFRITAAREAPLPHWPR